MQDQTLKCVWSPHAPTPIKLDTNGFKNLFFFFVKVYTINLAFTKSHKNTEKVPILLLRVCVCPLGDTSKPDPG